MMNFVLFKPLVANLEFEQNKKRSFKAHPKGYYPNEHSNEKSQWHQPTTICKVWIGIIFKGTCSIVL